MANPKTKRNKIKVGRLITPIGIARYPHLNKADTKWKAEGEYRVALIYDEVTATTLRAKLDDLLDKAYVDLVKEHFDGLPAKAKKVKKGDVPMKAEEDEEGEETGRQIVTVKRTASGTKKDGTAWKAKITICDSKGRKLPTPPAIWSGSKLRADCDVFGWYSPKDNVVGLKLEIAGIQIVELVSGGGDREASFDEVEDGYVADDEAPFDTTDDGAEDDSSPDF